MLLKSCLSYQLQKWLSQEKLEIKQDHVSCTGWIWVYELFDNGVYHNHQDAHLCQNWTIFCGIHWSCQLVLMISGDVQCIHLLIMTASISCNFCIWNGSNIDHSEHHYSTASEHQSSTILCKSFLHDVKQGCYLLMYKIIVVFCSMLAGKKKKPGWVWWIHYLESDPCLVCIQVLRSLNTVSIG